MEATTPIPAGTTEQSGTPAPYGRACINCSRAKSKCIVRSTGDSCERCHRLKKTCNPSLSIRKRNPKKPASSRASKLEEKLDSIVSLLASNNQSNLTIPNNSSNEASKPRQDDQTLGNGMGEMQADERQISNISTPPATSSEWTVNGSPKSTDNQFYEPSQEEADECLNLFRNERLQYLPVVHIPLQLSAQQLHQDRPFLWLCIMAMTVKSNPHQVILARRMKETLGRKVLIDCDKNIDILTGLLVYISWANHMLHIGAQELCSPNQKLSTIAVLTQLAIAIVFDLGLNKQLPKDPHAMVSIKSMAIQRPLPVAVRTMEERRAVLGCYLLSSIMGACMHKLDPMRWTSHMEESLHILSSFKECPLDEVLVQQVRLQLLADKVTYAPWKDPESESFKLMGVSPDFYLRSLQTQLQELKQKIPPGFEQNVPILLHFFETELTVNETVISSIATLVGSSGFYRLESLAKCLGAIKGWFDVYFNIPVASYVGFPFGMFTQLAHFMMVLYRLSMLDEPGWDKELVKHTLDFEVVWSRVLQNMELASQISGYNDDHSGQDLFTKGVRMLTFFKINMVVKMATAESTEPTTTEGPRFNEFDSEFLPFDLFLDQPLLDNLGSSEL